MDVVVEVVRAGILVWVVKLWWLLWSRVVVVRVVALVVREITVVSIIVVETVVVVTPSAFASPIAILPIVPVVLSVLLTSVHDAKD